MSGQNNVSTLPCGRSELQRSTAEDPAATSGNSALQRAVDGPAQEEQVKVTLGGVMELQPCQILQGLIRPACRCLRSRSMSPERNELQQDISPARGPLRERSSYPLLDNGPGHGRDKEQFQPFYSDSYHLRGKQALVFAHRSSAVGRLPSQMALAMALATTASSSKGSRWQPASHPRRQL